MATTLYGIKTCDTVRKARAYLDDRKIAYRFHDFRVDGLDASIVDRWIGELGWERLVNKSSTTFRDLPAAQKDGLDAAAARRLMLEHPTLIKRPVLEATVLEVGFRPARYDEIFGG
ncbi:MAG: ArsC family reductase [Rhizobiaceae bacterium]|nr:ArsC family reductase [Rhizobiaceae bacterium]